MLFCGQRCLALGARLAWQSPGCSQMCSDLVFELLLLSLSTGCFFFLSSPPLPFSILASFLHFAGGGGAARDQAQGLALTRQALYHWLHPQAFSPYPLICSSFLPFSSLPFAFSVILSLGIECLCTELHLQTFINFLF